MPARWRRTVVSITALAIASLLAATSTATAVAPELDEESSAKYTLLPDEGLVHVEKRITIKHRKKPTTRMDPCEDDPDQRCEIDVNYFWKAWGPIEVPAEATNVEISVAGGGAQIIEQDDDWVSYVVTFPELHYKQNRKISITYDLPDAEPRSGLDTRVNDAYARFCWYGEPADGGSVSAILPAGYQPRTDGPKVKTRRSAKASTVKRTIRGDPATFYACTEAFQPDRLARTYILGPSQQVVTIDSWRDDPSWRESLLDVVGVDLGALEAVIGSPMPLDELTILEVARNSPFGSPDDFDRKRAQLRVGDDLETPGVATVALARTWFNDQTIADPGLREGLALWSGLTVAGATCPVLAGPADEQTSDPSEWPAAVQRPGSDAARMLERQRAVACALVADTADELGPEAMAAVITSLLTDDAQISLLAAVEAAASADAVAALPSVVPEPD